MQNSVLGTFERRLARGAALVLIGGLAAGCSSSVARFTDGADGIMTASVPSQPVGSVSAASQPFPGTAQPMAESHSINRAAVEPVTAASQVSRNTLPPPPVGAASQPAAQAAAQQPATQTIAAVPSARPATHAAVASAENAVLTTPKTDRIASAPVAAHDVAGWSRAGGTQVAVKEGETVYNLSRRFGVPADVIMKVNGIEGGSLRAGQQVVIPTYVYNRKAPVSAPDANPNVADAKSSTGTRYDVPANKVPVPSQAPQQTVAVLPQVPKVKEQPAVAAATADTAPANGKPQAPAKVQAGTYTVASGDSLYKIAGKTGVKVVDLKAANGLSDGVLKIGQTLVIPTGGAAATAVAKAEPKVDPITTAAAVKPAKPAAAQQPVKAQAAAYAPTSGAIAAVEAEDNAEAPDATGVGKMRWPVRGRVIQNYGQSAGNRSDGIDIAVPEGTPVKAAENGVVIYAGDGLKEFGNTVLVRHDDGLVTVYGHTSNLKVQRGDKVKRGQDIALSGMSGSAQTPKLHFEVRKNSVPVNPSGFLD